MPRIRNCSPAVALAVLVLVLTGCGGGGDGGTDTTARTETTATPTPTSTPAGDDGDDGGGTKAPKGVSAKSVNAARDTIVDVCAQRQKKSNKPSEAESIGDLREAAEDLEKGFRVNADSKFRRSPGAPPASMRDRLRAMALVLSTRCGGGEAKEIAEELVDTATKKAEKKPKKKKKPKPKKTATPTPTPTPTATATPTATPEG